MTWTIDPVRVQGYRKYLDKDLAFFRSHQEKLNLDESALTQWKEDIRHELDRDLTGREPTLVLEWLPMLVTDYRQVLKLLAMDDVPEVLVRHNRERLTQCQKDIEYLIQKRKEALDEGRDGFYTTSLDHQVWERDDWQVVYPTTWHKSTWEDNMKKTEEEEYQTVNRRFSSRFLTWLGHPHRADLAKNYLSLIEMTEKFCGKIQSSLEGEEITLARLLEYWQTEEDKLDPDDPQGAENFYNLHGVFDTPFVLGRLAHLFGPIPETFLLGQALAPPPSVEFRRGDVAGHIEVFDYGGHGVNHIALNARGDEDKLGPILDDFIDLLLESPDLAEATVLGRHRPDTVRMGVRDGEMFWEQYSPQEPWESGWWQK